MLKRKIPLLITFLVGALFLVAKFIPHKPFSNLEEDFSIYYDVISTFAFILGGGSLLKIHLEKMSKKKPGYGYSYVTVISFAAVLIIGFLKLWNPSGFFLGAVDAEGSGFFWIYDNMFRPLGATMFALLAFYVASASYRAFRAKNKEATILLVSAFIILLGRTFFGVMLTAKLPDSLEFLKIPVLANWIMSFPNLAGQRAIMIGIALGIVSMSIKMIIGVERGYLGSGEGE